ncbi:Fpg/Nei family DNA glycosylase [Leifsonia sp. ZF2019]|uniref:DNA-formamidopyrimidine glycosylase family protein n=1 Tax=Leifsonia sp. ZF2019 TaxID=2781978 RepID=UPI001CBA9B90|nr:DNA-formamidopyrimidine glycosylase family protein [Leifsonia sp. ZF2019]UAJ78792.1 Fpg/Nei family DNA glycosylase [Leifsonia sp. ZF2019]
MPEGDTVYQAARRLRESLAGRILTATDFRVPRFATVDFSGERVDDVLSRGKHLLMRAGGFTIHSHLKMEGSWEVYRSGERWRHPAFQARVVLRTAEAEAVGFLLGILEVVPRSQEQDVVGHLGPDLLGADWDADEAVRRVSAHPDIPIGVALLDQRNLAGLGNVYANELCFLRGMLPTRPVAEADVPAAVDLGHRLIVANRDRPLRVTTGDTRRGRNTWVYGRGGQPCRRCGTRIRRTELGRTELEERVTYYCPSCQT